MKVSRYLSSIVAVFSKKGETIPPLSVGENITDDETLLIKQKIEQRKRKQKKIRITFFTLSVLVVAFGIFSAYSQYKLHTLKKAEQGSVSVSPKTGQEVVEALSRHILVPQSVPQVAIVQDASRLKETQAFFKDVENDDVVVVYETAIYIYRPSKDIVVNAGDISGVGQINP